MKIADILLDVDFYVPNSIDERVKLRWLNETQKQMYRDYGFPDKSHTFSTVIGQNKYDLPSDCQRDRISRLNVDTTEYAYRAPEEDVVNQTWTILDEQLQIEPVPNRVVTVEMLYKPQPADYTLEQMEEEPTLPFEFHEVLAFGVAYRVASAMQNFDLSERMRERMLSLQEEAKRKLRRNNRKKTVISRFWR